MKPFKQTRIRKFLASLLVSRRSPLGSRGQGSSAGSGVKDMRFRIRQDHSDGDADKEEDFYVLRNTHCPALLVENLFFDNRREAEFLLSDEGRMRIALTLLKAIMEAETTEPTTHPRPPATPSLY